MKSRLLALALAATLPVLAWHATSLAGDDGGEGGVTEAGGGAPDASSDAPAETQSDTGSTEPGDSSDDVQKPFDEACAPTTKPDTDANLGDTGSDTAAASSSSGGGCSISPSDREEGHLWLGAAALVLGLSLGRRRRPRLS
jgi:hypothetical protein